MRRRREKLRDERRQRCGVYQRHERRYDLEVREDHLEHHQTNVLRRLGVAGRKNGAQGEKGSKAHKAHRHQKQHQPVLPAGRARGARRARVPKARRTRAASRPNVPAAAHAASFAAGERNTCVEHSRVVVRAPETGLSSDRVRAVAHRVHRARRTCRCADQAVFSARYAALQLQRRRFEPNDRRRLLWRRELELEAFSKHASNRNAPEPVVVGRQRALDRDFDQFHGRCVGRDAGEVHHHQDGRKESWVVDNVVRCVGAVHNWVRINQPRRRDGNAPRRERA